MEHLTTSRRHREQWEATRSDRKSQQFAFYTTNLSDHTERFDAYTPKACLESVVAATAPATAARPRRGEVVVGREGLGPSAREGALLCREYRDT